MTTDVARGDLVDVPGDWSWFDFRRTLVDAGCPTLLLPKLDHLRAVLVSSVRRAVAATVNEPHSTRRPSLGPFSPYGRLSVIQGSGCENGEKSLDRKPIFNF